MILTSLFTFDDFITYSLYLAGFLVFLALVIIAIHCYNSYWINKDFQKNMKPGEKCFCFMDYDKIPYFIRKVEGCMVTIEDEEGNLLAVGKDQLYM